MAEDNDEPRLSKPKVVGPNYPGNSRKAKEGSEKETTERKKQEKVIEGVAIQRSKPVGRKIVETFAGDNVHNVGQYILFDVLLPAAKSMISDAVSQGIERLLFGDSRGRRISTGGGTGGRYTSGYNKMYTAAPGQGSTRSDLDRPGGVDMSRRARASHDFSEIILPTRADAETVLYRLGDLVDGFDVATVSDLYELVGITGNFTDEKYGWNDLRGSGVERVRDGYLINLPKPQPID
jgi:hypothetical protein